MKRTLALLAVLLVAPALILFAGGKKEADENQLEIFSWWTAGGEATGLAEMFRIYSEQYPDVEIINATVAGGAGQNAKERTKCGTAQDRLPGLAEIASCRHQPGNPCRVDVAFFAVLKIANDLGERKQAHSDNNELDPFDLICHLVFDQPPLTRRQRAEEPADSPSRRDLQRPDGLVAWELEVTLGREVAQPRCAGRFDHRP